MEDRIESLILRELVINQQFRDKVYPHLKAEYFEDDVEKDVFKFIHDFISKYSNPPTLEVMRIAFATQPGNEKTKKQRVDYIQSLEEDQRDEPNIDWLVSRTEKFCRDTSFLNALVECAEIIEKNKKNPEKHKDYSAARNIIESSLSITFNNDVGHDYFEEIKERFDTLRRADDKIPFDMNKFNEATRGGLPKKTLSIVMAGTGVGKSLFLCHHAAHLIKIGKSVLYITMEMAEEKIAERVDENLLVLTQEELYELSEDAFIKRLTEVKKRTLGRLIIKEYPNGGAHAGHFRALIKELQLKKKFYPDVVIVDYLNICASERVSIGDAGLYGYAKMIAEELRGLAVEMGLQMWTATQLNREGYKSTDVSITHTSESLGVPQTADFYFAITEDEILKKMNQLLARIQKNRYGPLTKFAIGVDKSKMRMYDLESEAQMNVEGTNEFETNSIKKKAGKGRVPGATQKPPSDLTSFDWGN